VTSYKENSQRVSYGPDDAAILCNAGHRSTKLAASAQVIAGGVCAAETGGHRAMPASATSAARS
jgi:hypothetical protein